MRGEETMKEKTTKDIKKMSREEFLYHNTELLLKKYRDVVWSIEASAIQAEISFELEMDCRLEEFLEMSYEAGADLSGTHIQEQMRTLERNKKMLKIIESALDILHRKHVDGEVYYWIIYYTFMSERPCRNVEDIITHIGMKTDTLSWKTYFKKRRLAIETLSSILWGYAAKDSLMLLENFEQI